MDVQQLKYYSRWHDHVNQHLYEAPADPWSPLRVAPDRLTRHNQEIRLNWGLGRVMGGEWDRDEYCAPLEETAIYQGLVQRFEQDRPWEETALYQRAQAQFDEHGQFRGYGSIDEYRSVRCAYVDALFESIRDEGYRSNIADGHDPAAETPFEQAYVHHLEPLVTIGRDGELYIAEGFHRIVIGQLLDLEAIPVQVLCRHEEWQRTRDRVARNLGAGQSGERTEVTDHPDLLDIR